MTAAECPHSIALDPAFCVLCKEAAYGAEPVPTTEPDGPAFAAHFDGQCPSCNLPVRPGERVRKWTDQLYRHERCMP